MGARPYDPTTGRFLAVDPIDGGSLNNYDYAGQDPINCYDLSGSFIIKREKLATVVMAIMNYVSKTLADREFPDSVVDTRPVATGEPHPTQPEEPVAEPVSAPSDKTASTSEYSWDPNVLAPPSEAPDMKMPIFELPDLTTPSFDDPDFKTPIIEPPSLTPPPFIVPEFVSTNLLS